MCASVYSYLQSAPNSVNESTARWEKLVHYSSYPMILKKSHKSQRWILRLDEAVQKINLLKLVHSSKKRRADGNTKPGLQLSNCVLRSAAKCLSAVTIYVIMFKVLVTNPLNCSQSPEYTV